MTGRPGRGDSEGTADDDVAVDAAMRQAYRDFFRSVRFTGAAGTVAAAGVFVALAHDRVPTLRLQVWFIGAVTGAIFLVAAFSNRRSAAWTDALGAPRLSLAAHAFVGTTWGLTPWLVPPDLRDRADTLTALTVLFAVSAGAVGGIQPSALLSRAVLTPMWGIAAAGFAVDGQWAIAGGGLIFYLLVNGDLAAGSALFEESVRFRISAERVAARGLADSERDPLTGLPNRAGLDAGIDAMCDGGATDITTIFLDLDHFKDVNDRWGHHAGDEALSVIARRLEPVVHGADGVISRFGGDEFLIVIPRHLDDVAAETLAAELIATVEAPIDLGAGRVARVSASMGLTSMPASRFDVEVAHVEADQALYEAKGRGRRQARSYHANRDRRPAGLVSKLREAVDGAVIEPWGQPIVDLSSGQVRAVEILARWTTSSGEQIPPDVFIPVADEVGIIGDITRQFFDRAADTLARWRGHPVLGQTALSVNISPRYLAEQTLVTDIVELFSPEHVAMGRLWLEITESHDLIQMTDGPELLERAERLGAIIAVDDFGTGYTSVRQLHDLPVSIVKLDRWLTEDLDPTGERIDLARAVHAVAASLGHMIVAEGIETTEQRTAVQALGIRYAQGHLFARPTPLDQLTADLMPDALTTDTPVPEH